MARASKGPDWLQMLDLERARYNLKTEDYGDWHNDPWGWPELDFVASKAPELLAARANQAGLVRPSLLAVPKENWGTRPAVVLDPLDRFLYQALVDVNSNRFDALTPNAFGWRLPNKDPQSGHYARNTSEWENFRDHIGTLARLYPVALKTDLVSCFASLPSDRMSATIDEACGTSAATARLINILESFNRTPSRSGLPQRSLASAVLANFYLSRLDEYLEAVSKRLPMVKGSGFRRHSFARWMDDIWFFCKDAGRARRVQMELQAAAQDIGLYLNFDKTEVLEGQDVLDDALAIEHSAVDVALLVKNTGPLESMIDQILDDPERVDVTTVKFAYKRIRNTGSTYRILEILERAKRMPHAAETTARTLAAGVDSTDLQAWFLAYIKSDWATHEWAVANFLRMFPSDSAPRKPIKDFAAARLNDAKTSLPLLAASAQRLSSWAPIESREVLRSAYQVAATPAARRIIILAALSVGERKSKIAEWLKADDELEPAYRMLEDRSYKVPKVTEFFLG